MNSGFDPEAFEARAASMSDAELEAFCEDSDNGDEASAARHELRDRAYNRAQAAQKEFADVLNSVGVRSRDAMERNSIKLAGHLTAKYEHVEASAERSFGRVWSKL